MLLLPAEVTPIFTPVEGLVELTVRIYVAAFVPLPPPHATIKRLAPAANTRAVCLIAFRTFRSHPAAQQHSSCGFLSGRGESTSGFYEYDPFYRFWYACRRSVSCFVANPIITAEAAQIRGIPALAQKSGGCPKARNDQWVCRQSTRHALLSFPQSRQAP